ncbi:MAG: CCA tRNA nucleotidyltransferase [Candidatus Nanopelagicales bacterium]|nr:CCA tRNA nucleotidyltransferase [Candidatus Nanopelagicales bacterium]MDZ4248808.1 CCA tRNA nucleotidyltransferase [Candidatus Nanopelagicales bacterium]
MTEPTASTVLAQIRQRAVADLVDRVPELVDLGKLFAAAGNELAAVGGCVRDAVLGELEHVDVDLATDAHPDVALGILGRWADSVWDVGIGFGTVGARKHGLTWEVTTYRCDSYDLSSRKPAVQYGSSLSEDLVRRDFTINAMAVVLEDLRFVDEHNGLVDLAARRLRTPGPPERSFSDDPLRMMRAARFVSQLGVVVAPDALAAITDMCDRLAIVSAERIRDELTRLLMGANPRAGLGVLVDTGLAEYVVPEVAGLRLEADEHHRHKDVYEHTLTVLDQAIALEDSGPDLVLRLAALMHDIGKPRTRRFEADGQVSFHHHEVVGARMATKRLTTLRYSKEIVADVARLVELHLRFHGYGTGQWTDAAVRRYVRDAGPLLPRLHKLTRADCTTRNPRRGRALQRAYDDVEARIDRLAAQEELDLIRPELDGNQIMEILGVPPSREVGEAYQFLLELRLEDGPIGPEAARTALEAWWVERSG